MKKKLFSFTEPNESVPVQKLTLMDQIRYIVFKLTHSDKDELNALTAVQQYRLSLKADLFSFLEKATDPLRKGKYKKVTVLISCKFKPVLQEVLNSAQIAPFYNVSVEEPTLIYNVHFNYRVNLEVKDC